MRDANDPTLVRRLELESGLTVARQAPPPGTHSIAISYVGPAGWAFDPSGREGTAHQVAQLIVSAAGRRDRIALARTLDELGASLSARPAPESIDVSIWGPATAWTLLLEILADVVQRPRFDPEDVARVQRQHHEGQLRELAQPGSRADRELLREIFPQGHPYRETGEGTPRSLQRTRRTDLVGFHRDRFSSQGAFVVATVPASLEQLRTRVGQLFDTLPGRAPSPPKLPRPRRSSSPQSIRRIAMPGRSQVEVRMGGASIARRNEAYPGAFLANEVLGGRGMLSRLFQNVREKAGLAYHAASEFEAMRYGGYWAARAGTGPERVERVVRLLKGEVVRITEEPVPSAELETARESTIGELPLELETTAGAHEIAVDIVYHGLPDDHLRQWPSILRALRPVQVRDAAAVAFPAASAVWVRAGPVP